MCSFILSCYPCSLLTTNRGFDIYSKVSFKTISMYDIAIEHMFHTVRVDRLSFPSSEWVAVRYMDTARDIAFGRYNLLRFTCWDQERPSMRDRRGN